MQVWVCLQEPVFFIEAQAHYLKKPVIWAKDAQYMSLLLSDFIPEFIYGILWCFWDFRIFPFKQMELNDFERGQWTLNNPI